MFGVFGQLSLNVRHVRTKACSGTYVRKNAPVNLSKFTYYVRNQAAEADRRLGGRGGVALRLGVAFAQCALRAHSRRPHLELT